MLSDTNRDWNIVQEKLEWKIQKFNYQWRDICWNISYVTTTFDSSFITNREGANIQFQTGSDKFFLSLHWMESLGAGRG